MTEDPDNEPGMPPALTISAVIPTRNRPESLERVLRALASQTRLPDEVLVVDSSDEALDEAALQALCSVLSVSYQHTPPGVCAQRNIGIRAATGSHVLLVDDDIEPSCDYIETLTRYLEAHPDRGAVTGIIDERGGSRDDPVAFAVPSLRHLLFSFVFQLNVMADVESARSTWITAPPLAALKWWYRRRGNSWTLAGWPLLTQVGQRPPSTGTAIPVAIYTLGAALVRRDWLLDAPYEERLSAHGIGDNYGVAIGFPGELPVSLLTDLPIVHHRASENRLDHAEAYFQRVLALDYFVRRSDRFPRSTPAWLAWSLLGNAGLFTLRGRRELALRSLRASGLVATARNPLLHQALAAPTATRGPSTP